MKITCQACQSKYTISDDKIQGKVAKIRCRKCGATVLVNASSGAAAAASGSASATASSAQTNGPAGPADAWVVSVGEGDQRTMTLRELVDAYASGIIQAETYVWKEGMADWQSVADVGELASALKSASSGSKGLADLAEPASPGAVVPAAARRDPGRTAGDLFAGGTTEEEVATSIPSQYLGRSGVGSSGKSPTSSDATAAAQAGLTGARDEHSVLFSLSALTGPPKQTAQSMPGAPGDAAPPRRNEDSGLIDLNALAQAQRARAPQMTEAPVSAPAQFMFPAALGTVEVPVVESPPKSRVPMFIGGGIALAGILAAVAILAGGKKEDPRDAAGVAQSAAAAAAVEQAASAAAAAPTVSAASPTDTAAPAESSSAAANRANRRAPSPAARPGVRPAGNAPAAAPVAPVVPPPRKNPCGCTTGDLQCQIRCSATGK